MKVTLGFTITAEIDPPFDILEQNPQYIRYVKESVDEFGQDIKNFLENHPLIASCSMETKETQ